MVLHTEEGHHIVVEVLAAAVEDHLGEEDHLEVVEVEVVGRRTSNFFFKLNNGIMFECSWSQTN